MSIPNPDTARLNIALALRAQTEEVTVASTAVAALDTDSSINADSLNHPNFAPPHGNLSSPLFGQSTALVNSNGSSGNRRLDLQLRFNF